MAIQVSLETALRSLIVGLPAFAALSPVPVVRPYKLAETDFLVGTGARAVIIESPEETVQEDLDDLGAAISARAIVEVVAESLDDAWNLAEIIRTNGTTPGSGLAGFKGNIANVTGIFIQRIALNKTEKDYMPYYDGSDDGFYYVRRELTVDFTQQG